MESDRDPFVRLENTHRRIEQRLMTLERATAEIDDSVLRFDALHDVEAVVAFLGRGAARHHDDEERSLFPRLRAIARENEPLAALLRALEDEHRLHDELYKELAALVDGFPSEGPDRATERRLGALADRLATAYRAHIAREEEELFPLAKRLLDPATFAAMSDEMDSRRAPPG